MSTTTTNPADVFTDELVTKAHLREVTVPGLDGKVALITIDNGEDHTKPSTFGPGGLASLSEAIDAAIAAKPAAIAVTGKPFIFAVGADLSGVPSVTDRELARQIAEAGHETFGKLIKTDIPTFAFVNGAALGGGLELALACDYRSLSSNAAMVGFPEVFLGLVPGWGGTQLLPNLIGADKAVTVIIENAMNQNKTLRPAQVKEFGIVDEVFDSADFLEKSLFWLRDVVTGKTTVERPEVDRGEGWDAALARGKAIADARSHGAADGAYRALQLMELARTASIDESFAAENDALADLLMSDSLRASLYSFDLVQKRAKRPVGAPDKKLARPVTKVGIVGAGLMASQLALLFVRKLEVPVVMTDLDQERADKGVAYVVAELDKLLQKKRISPDKHNRLKALISGEVGYESFADADFVIEAVFEELELKKQIFGEIEKHTSAECVFATNTSSLSITDMAAGLSHPERVVGFHFFNPVAVLPLLEIIRGEKTDDATLATAFATGKKLGKSCVLVKDAPGFVVNRLLTRFLGTVIGTIDDGTDFAVADQALEPLGLPMSPLVLLQLVGPAVALHTAETLHEAFPERFGVSENMKKFVDAGKSGVYVWDEKGRPSVDPEVEALWSRGDSPLTGEQVRTKALEAIAEEVKLMLDEGVVAGPQDIDLCLILGAGWPFWNGGITPYLDRTGVSESVNGERFLPPGVASLS